MPVEPDEFFFIRIFYLQIPLIGTMNRITNMTRQVVISQSHAQSIFFLSDVHDPLQRRPLLGLLDDLLNQVFYLFPVLLQVCSRKVDLSCREVIPNPPACRTEEGFTRGNRFLRPHPSSFLIDGMAFGAVDALGIFTPFDIWIMPFLLDIPVYAHIPS